MLPSPPSSNNCLALPWFNWATIRCFVTSAQECLASPSPHPGQGLGPGCTNSPWHKGTCTHTPPTLAAKQPRYRVSCWWCSPAAGHKPQSHRVCPIHLLQCVVVKQKNVLLLFSSLTPVYHWRRWSFAGVPIAFYASMQQLKMWCSFHQSTEWYVYATRGNSNGILLTFFSPLPGSNTNLNTNSFTC